MGKPVFALIAAAGIALAAIASPAGAQQDEAADRAAIHKLLMDYGRTLDERDFDGFSALFTQDGSYNGTPGPEAGEMMRKVFAENRLGLPDPKYHIFFNEVVTLDGPDSARATAMSFYVAPDELNRPAPVMMASYDDVLVRVDGEWKFFSRKVNGLMAMKPPAQ